MNDKTRGLIQSIAGIYIIYLGIQLLTNPDRPDNYIIFMIIGVVFVIAGAGIVFLRMRSVFTVSQEEQMGDEDDDTESNEVEDESDDAKVAIEESQVIDEVSEVDASVDMCDMDDGE